MFSETEVMVMECWGAPDFGAAEQAVFGRKRA